MSLDADVVAALALRPDSSPERHLIHITTIGARTGAPRRIEIWFHRVDGRFYLTGTPARRGWYANLRKNPRFTFHLKRGITADLAATAVVADHDTRQSVIPQIVGQQDLPEYAARGVPRQDVDVWLAHSPLLEIVFDDADLQVAASAA